jgi:diaminohydroxyphosphoribosylaminopyrimidine deaminase/5-amino-6-(5-phosphoribosylamino)uracil reductase
LTCKEEALGEAAASLRQRGVRIVGLDSGQRGLDLRAGLQTLFREQGCSHLLCEGGGRLATSLAEAGLADELHLYLAPRILGDETGRNAFCGRRVDRMDEALAWRMVESTRLGEDLRLRLRPAAANRCRG